MKTWHFLLICSFLLLLLFGLIALFRSGQSLNMSSCGRNSPRTDLPVNHTAGTFRDSRPGEHPWTVHIYCVNSLQQTNATYFGLLLNNRWIVMAKRRYQDQCLSPRSTYILRIGRETSTGRTVNIEQMVAHPSDLLHMIKIEWVDFQLGDLDPYSYSISSICVDNSVNWTVDRTYQLNTFQAVAGQNVDKLVVVDNITGVNIVNCTTQTMAALVKGNRTNPRQVIVLPGLVETCLNSVLSSFHQLSVPGSPMIRRQDNGNHYLVAMFSSFQTPSEFRFYKMSAYHSWMESVISDNEDGLLTIFPWTLGNLSLGLLFAIHFYELVIFGAVYLVYLAWKLYQKKREVDLKKKELQREKKMQEARESDLAKKDAPKLDEQNVQKTDSKAKSERKQAETQKSSVSKGSKETQANKKFF